MLRCNWRSDWPRRAVYNARSAGRNPAGANGVRGQGIDSVAIFQRSVSWYNILPGRSVSIRRLAIHLFELKADANTERADFGWKSWKWTFEEPAKAFLWCAAWENAL